jgi:hypothetical protein
MRGFMQRILVGVAGTVVLGIVLACPPSKPPPQNPPDASDAAPSPPPAPTVSCDDACRHADAVCPNSLSPCGNACTRIGPVYATCAAGLVAGAGACPALNNCDPLNTLNVAGASKPHGR